MLRIISLIFSLIGLIIVLVLAFLNSEPVNFDYLLSSTELPLSVLLLICFILGVVVSTISYLGVIYFQRRQLKRYRKLK